MIFQFKVQIKGIAKPPVWRKVTVPGNFSFIQFHEIIQALFGWTDSHMFKFCDTDFNSSITIALPQEDNWFVDDEDDAVKNTLDPMKTKLSVVFNTVGQKLLYIYDFGDYWVHSITLEEISEAKGKTAKCISGKGSCPPEDCGGIWGYEDLKEVFEKDPNSDEAMNLREWLGYEDGEIWDPKYFDLEETNLLLTDI